MGRLGRDPVRIILVKARQWGGSTLTQFFMAWIQQFHKTEWNMAIIAEDQGQARHVRHMCRTLVEHYPLQYGSITLSPYEASSNTVMVEEHLYIERFRPAGDGMGYFEQKPDGSLGHAEGQHDDLVDSRVGSLYLALKYYDSVNYPAVEVEPRPKREEQKSAAMDAATFK